MRTDRRKKQKGSNKAVKTPSRASVQTSLEIIGSSRRFRKHWSIENGAQSWINPASYDGVVMEGDTVETNSNRV
jgi:hypothetical protein